MSRHVTQKTVIKQAQPGGLKAGSFPVRRGDRFDHIIECRVCGRLQGRCLDRQWAVIGLGGSPSRIGSRFATGNSLKRAKELQQVLFFRRRQFGAEDQVEKLDRIVQRQEPPVVQVGWRVLDAT